jgi:monoamine oxidase
MTRRNTVIVGAGLAGLLTAERCAKAGDRVTIIEKYDYIGGRVLTSKRGYEIGAGRVGGSHTRVWALVRRFGLHRSRHNPHTEYRRLGTAESEPNTFSTVFAPVLKAIEPAATGSTTLGRLLTTTDAPVNTLQFPYRAELQRLRADLGAHAFRTEFSAEETYYSVIEGLSAIIRGLTDACKAADVRFVLEREVTDVVRTTGDRYQVHMKGFSPIVADRVVLALHATALSKLPCMQTARFLKHLTMAPLTRIYAQYPTPAWFPPIRVVTDSPLRYIIPIDTEKGVVMISYTDDQDTRAWVHLKGEQLTAAIQKEVRRLFPERTIPEPLWCKAYEWTEGCTYWKPGSYDPIAMSREAMNPMPTAMPQLYVTGESVCLRQAWMEGALEHAEQLWNTYLRD